MELNASSDVTFVWWTLATCAVLAVAASLRLDWWLFNRSSPLRRFDKRGVGEHNECITTTGKNVFIKVLEKNDSIPHSINLDEPVGETLLRFEKTYPTALPQLYFYSPSKGELKPTLSWTENGIGKDSTISLLSRLPGGAADSVRHARQSHAASQAHSRGRHIAPTAKMLSAPAVVATTQYCPR